MEAALPPHPEPVGSGFTLLPKRARKLTAEVSRWLDSRRDKGTGVAIMVGKDES